MKTHIHPAIHGTCALAVAALLASPSFADARPRQGTHGGHDRTVSPSGSSSRSGSSTSGQRSDHGGSGRSYETQRHYGESHQERPQVSAPRSLPPRLPESRPAPQQHAWSRPDDGAHRPTYSNPFQQRPSAPLGTGQRWHAPVTENPRQDDRNGWRTTPRTHQPSDSERYSGHDTRPETGTYGDRYRRYDGQYGGHDGRGSSGRYDSRYSGQRTQHFEGHVRRLEHGDGGYRVWLDHGDHCFWIPEARFLLWPLRIGLSVNFGGFWNSAGFYNVYDYGPNFGSYYGGSYYGSPYYGGSYSSSPYDGGAYNRSSILQGYIDRFDDANGTLVVRDDSSGRYATVLLRGDDPQFGYLQPGDWVTLSGAWTPGGYFEAYRIENLTQR